MLFFNLHERPIKIFLIKTYIYICRCTYIDIIVGFWLKDLDNEVAVLGAHSAFCCRWGAWERFMGQECFCPVLGWFSVLLKFRVHKKEN